MAGDIDSRSELTVIALGVSLQNVGMDYLYLEFYVTRRSEPVLKEEKKLMMSMRSFFNYLFVECSPIQIPFDFVPEVSQFFLSDMAREILTIAGVAYIPLIVLIVFRSGRLRGLNEDNMVKEFRMIVKCKPLNKEIGFICASFGLFVCFYKLIFGVVEKGNLVNPLQVLAQAAGFLFFREARKGKKLLLLSFFLSICSSLHLKGVDGRFLSLFVLLLFFSVLTMPLDFSYLVVFLGYFLDQELAKWGFYLAFQQVMYHTLSFFFERGQSSTPPKKLGLAFIFLLFFQLFIGFVFYGESFVAEPLRLAALLSGACIVFISLEKRTIWTFIPVLLIYLMVSVFIGIMLSPGDKATIFGLSYGLILFLCLHIWPLFGLFLFKDSLPKRRQPLIPVFFGGIFFLLTHFSELEWLEKWIEGIDLLLLILGIYSLIKEERSYPNLQGGTGAGGKPED
jgi:hypothetical protein